MGSNSSKTVFNYLQLLGDLLLVNIAIILAFLVRFMGDLPLYNFQPYLRLIPFITFFAFLVLNFYGLYQTSYKRWSEVFASLIVSVVILMVITISISYMIGGFSFPRTVFFIGSGFQVILLALWRRWLFVVERKMHPPRRIISVAPASENGCLVSKLGQSYGTVLGVITDDVDLEEVKAGERRYPVLGSYGDAVAVCSHYRPDAVIVSGAVTDEVKEALVNGALNYGWEVYVVPGLYEIMLSRTVVDQIEDIPVLKVNSGVNPGQNMVKRFMDVVISMFVLLVLSPLLLAVTVAIAINSRGSFLYRQERVGLGGRNFVLYKFRTMYNDAEADTGPVLATENDVRITRVGRFLRSTRIDELPQLYNVLRGDMSLVGPRPERPFFVEQYEKDIPGYNCRQMTEAGITGLAQVMSNYSTSTEDKLRYDLLYTKNRSPLFDLKILLQTMKVVLMKNRAS